MITKGSEEAEQTSWGNYFLIPVPSVKKKGQDVGGEEEMRANECEEGKGKEMQRRRGE